MIRCRLDRDVEHRHQHVTPLDRESLVALVRATEETLQSIYLGEPPQNRLLLFFTQRLVESSAFDLLTQPFPLLDFAEVGDLESDPRRVQIAQPRHDVGGAAARRAERETRNAGEMFLTQPMKFGRQLGGSFRSCSERIELDREMAVAANRIHQLSRGGDIAKKSGIKLSRSGGLYGNGWRRRTADTFRKSEELAPRFVDRSWIASVGFVRLRYITVVEYARDRGGVGAHASKFNFAPLASVRRYGCRAGTLNALRRH